MPGGRFVRKLSLFEKVELVILTIEVGAIIYGSVVLAIKASSRLCHHEGTSSHVCHYSVCYQRGLS